MKRILISALLTSMFGLIVMTTPALAGEPIPGIDVRLLRSGKVVATQTTGQNGMVTFEGLVPDSTVEITVDLDHLTALMKAKEKANRTKCSNNLRLVGGKNRWAQDPYSEDVMRLAADKQGEIKLQLTGECK